jgi:hypothetical protein
MSNHDLFACRLMKVRLSNDMARFYFYVERPQADGSVSKGLCCRG